jgi:hypothetical protein
MEALEKLWKTMTFSVKKTARSRIHIVSIKGHHILQRPPEKESVLFLAILLYTLDPKHYPSFRRWRGPSSDNEFHVLRVPSTTPDGPVVAGGEFATRPSLLTYKLPLLARLEGCLDTGFARFPI